MSLPFLYLQLSHRGIYPQNKGIYTYIVLCEILHKSRYISRQGSLPLSLEAVCQMLSPFLADIQMLSPFPGDVSIAVPLPSIYFLNTLAHLLPLPFTFAPLFPFQSGEWEKEGIPFIWSSGWDALLPELKSQVSAI